MNNVIVNQTLTAINVTPGSSVVPNGQTQSFSAAGADQFNNPMSPVVTWTLDTGGMGGINSSTGQYTAPSSGVGAATIRATSGSISGTATVTVQLTTIAGTTSDDTIRLVQTGSSLNVYINNPTTPAYSAPFASLGALTVLGNGGTDQILIDFSGSAAPVPTAGLTVDGTGGVANLSILGTSGDDVATVTTNTVTFDSSTIHYVNIATLAVNGGTGSDTLNVNSGTVTAIPRLHAGLGNSDGNVEHIIDRRRRCGHTRHCFRQHRPNRARPGFSSKRRTSAIRN